MSKTIMMRIALAAMLLCASTASAQVTVELRAERSTVVQTEPIVIVAEIKNVGEYTIGYGRGRRDFRLEVDGLLPTRSRQRCGLELPLPFSPVIHAPIFKPGQTVTFRYLVRGSHRLQPGRHEVRVVGTAPVWWSEGYAQITPDDAGRKPSPFTAADPVAGAMVDRSIPIVVVSPTREALELAFAPWIDKSKQSYSEESAMAREVIFESARSFHADLIAKLAAQHLPGGDPYQALADINTAESRAHLRRLYDEESDLRVRTGIIRALSRLWNPDSLEFLASLLPGRSTKADDRIRDHAVEGLRCIHGEAAVDALDKGTREWTDQGARVVALSRTQSPKAVDLIINTQIGGDAELKQTVCAALSDMTHYVWCDDDMSRQSFTRIQSRWRSWWSRNSGRVSLYDPWTNTGDYIPLKR